MSRIAIPLAALALALAPSGDWDAWAEWWQVHRRDYQPETPFEVVPAVDRRVNADPRREELVEKVEALCTTLLESPESALRRAAVITLARLAEPMAAAKIAPLAQDGDAAVRRGALLALGTVATDDARRRLLELAGGEASKPSAAADLGTAFVALALCRAGTLDSKVDGIVEARLAVGAKQAPELITGALMHQKLARVPSLWGHARAVSGEDGAPAAIRACALEVLAGSPNVEDYEWLASNLQSREPELRRAAAAALGSVRDPRATAALLAAVDGEKNTACRGFLMLSLGKRATAEAVTRLLAERQRATALDRAWAWMALGIAGRAGNTQARAALDLAPDTKLQPGEHATALIAVGLARQVGALDFLEAAAASKSEVDLGPYADCGLALMATSACRDLLLARLAEKPGDASRAVLADGLSRMRLEADSIQLIAHWRKAGTESLRREAALALGRHGALADIEALLERASEWSEPGADRAAALEAIGIALSRRPLDRLRGLATNADFLSRDAWILELARSGL